MTSTARDERARQRWRCVLTGLLLGVLGTSPALAQTVSGGGFSRPPVTEPVGKPGARNVIASVRVIGLSESDSVVAGLQSRAGQVPSRERLHADLETLWVLCDHRRVDPQWVSTPAGWELTFVVAPVEPTPPIGRVLTVVVEHEPAARVIRGQSESLSKSGGYSAPPPSRPMPAKPAAKKTAPAKFPPVSPVSAEDSPEDTPANAFTLEEPLADVRIEGNISILNSEISPIIKTRPGRVVTQEMIKDDVDALVRKRWFATVEPTLRRTDEGLVLVFRVLERPIVRNIEYRGAKKLKPEKLAALTNLKIGSPYDISANRECARRIEEEYHAKGFAFATVELEKGNDKDDREVIFLINEGSKVKVDDVEFEGNKFFSDAVLKLKLQTKQRIAWVFGGKYDPATIPNDKESIKGYYRSLGFFDATIEESLAFNDDKSLVTITYKINEGMRFKVRNIEVSGTHVITEEELRKDFSIEPGEFYTARKINSDVEKMREKYGNLGRLFAKVDAVPGYTEEPGVVDILYQIDEDKVYRVREFNVHIAGDHPHTRLNLARNISMIQPGDLADPQKIQKTKRRLEGSGVFEAGAEAGVRMDIRRVEDPSWIQSPQIDVARGQGTADLWSDAAPPARTEQKTSRPKIPATKPTAKPTQDQRGANYFVPPPTDDDVRIIRAQSNVLLTQSQGPMKSPSNYLYDNNNSGDPLAPSLRDPDPNIWEQLPPPEFIDVDAYLAEARTGRLMFGVGVNSNAGLVGNIVLSENNFDILKVPTSWADVVNGTAFRGRGQKFRIEAMPGTEVSRYLVDWQDPYFMDTDINLGLSGFYYQRFFRNWTEERLGGRVRLGRQLTQTWSTNVALRMEQVDISNIPSTAPQSLLDVDGGNFLSTVRLALMHDTRDAAFNPSSGHYVEAGIEQAFSEFDYTKYELEGRQYFTTYQRPDGYGKHILTLFGQVGWTGDSTPIFEKFYAGGFQSFRGFAFRGVTPIENNVEVGGQFQFLGSLEYMLPVTANEFLKVVAFSDFGTVDESATFDNFRVSVGAGLRVQVPGMGPVPIALDWAFPVVKQDFDRDQIFSFYIGINR